MRSFCPFWGGFKMHLLALIGECDPAGEKHGSGLFVPGTILVVTHQRETPAGKLHPDLVTASGMQPDADKALFS